MKKKFVAANFGIVDSQGDVLMPGCIKGLPKTVIVIKDFMAHEVIGVSEIKEENNQLVCETESKSGQLESYSGMYPAIQFQSIRHHIDENGNRVIDEMKLMCVSINEMPNNDKTIQALQ